MKNESGSRLMTRLGVRIAVPVSCLLFCLFPLVSVFPADLPGKTFDLTIARGAASAHPRVLRVEKDDIVRLRVTSEVAGNIHLHAYRLDANVAPGIPAELDFQARATGRFRIEWHAAGGAAEKADPHGPPLAILEVRPK